PGTHPALATIRGRSLRPRSPLGCLQDRRHLHGQAGQQLRGRLLAAPEHAVDRISRAFENQDGDLLQLAVDDPVLGDAGPGIFLALLHQVTIAIAWGVADYLYHEVRAIREVLAQP